MNIYEDLALHAASTRLINSITCPRSSRLYFKHTRNDREGAGCREPSKVLEARDRAAPLFDRPAILPCIPVRSRGINVCTPRTSHRRSVSLEFRKTQSQRAHDSSFPRRFLGWLQGAGREAELARAAWAGAGDDRCRGGLRAV